jgi:hypothetical protein
MFVMSVMFCEEQNEKTKNLEKKGKSEEMKSYVNNCFLLMLFIAVLLFVAQNEIVFCETTITLGSDVIDVYYGPMESVERPGSDDFIVGETLSMHITASINDPKVTAEIKDGTLEWRIKSLTFHYYGLDEQGESILVEEETYTDNATLKNSEDHPIIIKRPIGEWGAKACWKIDNVGDKAGEQGSTFNTSADWVLEFEIEFRAKHNSIDDCMIQATIPEKTYALHLRHYVGIMVDMYAIEGTDDTVDVQFGCLNYKNQSTESIKELRPFYAYFQIDWANNNNSGLVEADFIPKTPGNDLSIFRSARHRVTRYGNTGNQYDINFERNTFRQNKKVVTADFVLKADTGPNTETAIVEHAKISIMEYPLPTITEFRYIGYHVITDPIQENDAMGFVKNTEGRYLVNESTINVIRAITLFGGEHDATISGCGAPDLASDNEINANDIQQGGIGDCYFLVCLMILAENEKNFIRNQLVDTIDTVTGQKVYKVGLYPHPNNPPGTDGTVILPIDDLLTHGISQARLSGDFKTFSNGDKKVEIWPQVYEKAWAFVRNNQNLYGAINDGLPTDAWKVLTGETGTAISCANKSNDQIWNEITARIDMTTNKPVAGTYMIAGTKADIGKVDKTPYDIIEGYGVPVGPHVYVIDNIDPVMKKIDLKNPHGTNHVLLPYSEFSKILNEIFVLLKP